MSDKERKVHLADKAKFENLTSQIFRNVLE